MSPGRFSNDGKSPVRLSKGAATGGCLAQSRNGRLKTVWRGGATSGCGGAQVSVKAQCATNLIVRWIDSLGGWRYSQAQIPDLVANAIPRFLPRAQSFGLGVPDARRFAGKSIQICESRSSGAKARVALEGDARGLKPPSPSGFRSCAGAKAGAEEVGNSCRIGEQRPSAAKAEDFFVALTARLKSCPDTKRNVVAAIGGRDGDDNSDAGAKARVDFGAFSAPFDFALGRLLKSCPQKERKFRFNRIKRCHEVLRTPTHRTKTKTSDGWGTVSFRVGRRSRWTADTRCGELACRAWLKPRTFKNDNLTSTLQRRAGGSRFL
jgi:hypothetical protein